MAYLSDIPHIIRRSVKIGANVHLIGDPGIGKTQVIEQTVAQIRLNDPEFMLWTLYTPSLSPVDFSVPMPDVKTGMLRSYHSDRLPNGYTHPDARGIVFLGERDNADPATNKALQKYINNEDMGGLIKPRGVIVVSDSNELSHRSGVVQQSLALLSRSAVIKVIHDPNETLKHFADLGVNLYVQAYCQLRKEHINTFEELIAKREYRVWANPRAWVRLGALLDVADEEQGKLTDDEICGNVSEGVGREFIAFLHAARELVSYEDIAKKPETAFMPDKPSDMYAIVSMLANSVQAKDMPPVRAYIERYGIEIQVLFLRLMTSSKGKHRLACVQTEAYTSWFARPELRDVLLGK